MIKYSYSLPKTEIFSNQDEVKWQQLIFKLLWTSGITGGILFGSALPALSQNIFYWEADPNLPSGYIPSGGAEWDVDDTNRTYTNVDGSGVDITVELLDPDNQNLDSGNIGSAAGVTETNSSSQVGGAGRFTGGMTSTNSSQEVSLVFTFSQPVLLQDFLVGDIDAVTDSDSGSAGGYQDEVVFSAQDQNGNNVPITLSAPSGATFSIVNISGQTATALYGLNLGFFVIGDLNLTPTDQRGHVLANPQAAITQIRLDYSNGPDDDGVSDDHAIVVGLEGGLFQFDPVPLDYSDAPADGEPAPDSGSTTGYGEASHIIVSGTQLGANIDAETAAQSSANADGDGNDDDGVTIPSLITGQTVSITADVAGAGGYLQGWIDWNGDGSFDAGEQVATDIQDNGTGDTDNTAGTISFDVSVPTGAITTADTFARFRWSTTSGLDTTTLADDGEVEDYQVAIASLLDYGDAPDTYGTDDTGGNSSNNSDPVGASHMIDSRLYLGAIPDVDSNGFVDGIDDNGDATDDDASSGAGNGDDEGEITLPNLATGDTSYTVPAANITATNTTGTNATLHAWIDFDQSGTFEATEHTSVAVNNGTSGGNPVADLTWNGINVPISGDTYARFRLTTDNAVVATTPGGGASDGEVEDYQIAIANSNQTIVETSSCNALGGTLSGNNLFTPLDNGTFGFESGAADQSPSTNPYPGVVSGGNFDNFYNFDHGDYGYVANPVNPRNPFQHPGITDPVYGVTGRFFASDPNNDTPTLTTTLTGLTPNQFYEYSFWAANSEPNGNSNNVDVLVNGQRLYSTGPLPAIPEALEWKKHTVSFTNGANTSITIDLQSTETGSAGNDFYLDNIELKGCDFTVDYGDAPPSYGDAIHTTIPTSPNVYLGTVVPDGETATPLGGDNGADADGDDDNQTTNDEDAFSSFSNIPTSGTYDLNNIPVNNTSGADVTLHGWIDFDQDGQFSAAEHQSIVIANGDTTADLSWSIPSGTTEGDTYARFRITPDTFAVDDASTTDIDERSKDAVINGEVEDYQITISDNLTPPTVSCPADYDFKTFYWGDTASSSATEEVIVWSSGSQSNFYNINGNLLEATLNDPNNTNVTFANTNTFTGAIEPIGSGLQWQMDSNSTTQSETFTLDFDYPLAVSQFVIADIDASSSADPTNWHDQMTFSAFDSGTSLPVTLTPTNPSKIDVSGGTAFAADGVGNTLNTAADNGGVKPDADVTITMFNPADVLEIEFQNGPRSQTNPNSHGIAIGSFVGCFPRVDLGDAPDADAGTAQGDYQTRTIDDGARHVIVSGLQLGTAVDADSGTLNSSDATADDNDNTNDDDGVLLSGNSLQSQSLTTGDTFTLDIATQGSGVLNAWIDWNNDGDFLDDDEQIATNSVAGGAGDSDNATVGIQLDVTVPSGAVVGNTFARFRYSSDTDLEPTGAASDGEVEDYQIAIAEASTSLCPAARADLWFANDESGSVDSGEFNDSLDFIYQISDQFEYGEAAGIKAGIIGWAQNTPTAGTNNIIIPITDTFSDPGDTGLISDSNISTDGDNQGVREEYTGKVDLSNGTRLDRATSYLADLIIAGTANGGRANTPQIAIILTDAFTSQITNSGSGGGFNWISAADKLKNDAGAVIVLIIIDDAAEAYNTNTNAQQTIDTVVGDEGKLLIVPDYPTAADATQGYVELVAQSVCDSSNPVATDPEVLLTKRITAINPDQTDEVSFDDFVDDSTDADNHPQWPNSTENSGTFTNTYTVGETNGGEVLPGDVLEYTIYFLSSGDETANDVLVCDLVPANTEFITNDFDTVSPATGGTTGIDRGLLWEYNGNVESLTNDNDGDAGYYFPPGVEPSTVFPDIKCSDSNLPNTNGAVVVDLGDVPQATSSGDPIGSFGFIRFRARVK